MKFGLIFGAVLISAVLAQTAQGAIVGITFCSGAMTCAVTTQPPDPVSPDPNDGVFLAWEEIQHLTLTASLQVDRVLDPNASYVDDLGGGVYMLQPGLTVSSHYVQWDPGNDSSARAVMSMNFEGIVLGFITSDQNLNWSNSTLGLWSIDYGNFANRGLEEDDITNISGYRATLSWEADSPGDWARIITAAAPVPIPPSGFAAAAAFASLALLCLRRR